MYVEPLLAALHQPRLAESLEVLGSVCHRQGAVAGKRVDRTFTLGQQLEELESMRAHERLSDSGELAVEPVLEGAMGGVACCHVQLVNRLLEHTCQGPGAADISITSRRRQPGPPTAPCGARVPFSRSSRRKQAGASRTTCF